MKFRIFLLLVLFFQFICPRFIFSHAITYTLSGGRLGDNLLAYMHAKWACYQYDLPLYYLPFPLAEGFLFHEIEREKMASLPSRFRTQIHLRPMESFQNLFIRARFTKDALFIVPYFPESDWELIQSRVNGPPYSYFKVNWEDPDFHKLLKNLIAPKNPIAPMNLPKDKTTVAVHIRRGGSYESDSAIVRGQFPLKFPTDEFYLFQIRRLYNLLGKKPLYVFLFTDDEDPLQIKIKYLDHLTDLDIEIQCREKENHWNTNILEDFFHLTQFDCAIHSQSNFPVCAGLISDYQIEIYPKSYYEESGQIYIDKVTTKHRLLTIL